MPQQGTMGSGFQVVIVAMTTHFSEEFLPYLFLWRVLKMQLSKAPLFLGQLCWVKKNAAPVAQGIFMSLLPRKVLLHHRVDLLSDKANYHATAAPVLYFLGNPTGRHAHEEHGCSRLAVTAVPPTPCRQVARTASTCTLFSVDQLSVTHVRSAHMQTKGKGTPGRFPGHCKPRGAELCHFSTLRFSMYIARMQNFKCSS